jgi:hypothetical protein
MKASTFLFAAAALAVFPSASSMYMTTCHSNSECGTVCGKYSNDMVALSEGHWGTSCSCQSSGLKTVCTALGHTIQVCADGKAPHCKTACGRKICIKKGSKQTTGTILSACPKHHPVNTKQCCEHKNSAYCTCIIQPTIDVNAAPYKALGSANGEVSTVAGSCGSQLESLNISIDTERASQLIQPFLKEGTWTKLNASTEEYKTTHETECYGLTEGQCGAKTGCTFCNSQSKSHPVRTDCYNLGEAEMLEHIIATEDAPGKFTCNTVA